MMGDKACFKCGDLKPLEHFYRHSEMRDGHLNKCADCTKRDVRKHRLAHLDKVREYDRQRASLPHRAELRARVFVEWSRRHPERLRAQQMVRRAVRSGRLIKAIGCECCGFMGRIEAHHHDYNKPLDVQWLCKPCHADADATRRATEKVSH